jgi:beta-xylosidase
MIDIPTSRQGYSEGPFITKRKGIYYYFYTLGGGETYQYAYMMSRQSPLGPWETPAPDIIATSDVEQRIFGPGHGCFFRLAGTDDWYFVYLEYGRGSTNRQIYADRMHFNADGTIQPVKLTKQGVGALRPSRMPHRIWPQPQAPRPPPSVRSCPCPCAPIKAGDALKRMRRPTP